MVKGGRCVQQELTTQTVFFRKRSEKRKLWKRIVTGLASVVVFCTTYALILPAITMEGYVCGVTAHQHDENCYAIGPPGQLRTLVCDGGLSALHQHEDSCYTEGVLTCGYADYILHRHTEDCRDGEGRLICPLPEIAGHLHDESCWQQPHVHGTDCYTWQQGQLICTIEEGAVHTHDDSCRVARQELVCTQAEGPGHTHGGDCYTQVLICGLAEDENHRHDDGCVAIADTPQCGLEAGPGHTHGDTCLQTVYDLSCPLEEGVPHVHGNDCWERTQVLTCQQFTAEEGAQPQLICGQEQRLPHIHDDTCLDADGALCCGLLQTEEHTHGSLCFVITETEGEPSLCCGMEVHTHGPECLPPEEDPQPGLWADGRTCGMDEHQHGPECLDEYGALWCTIPEHTHWELCDLDPNKRDTADPDDSWLDNQPIPTGDPAADTAAVALAQVGYRESDAYYTVTDEAELRWYSRYADWWDGDGFSDWNAKLAAFCLETAGVTEVPLSDSAAQWPALLAEAELWQEAPAARAEAGRLAFFDGDGDGRAESVGIITEAEAESGEFTAVLEQNGRVREKHYASVPTTLLGVGLLERETQHLCGREEHAHSALCYDEDDLLSCGQDAHVHTDACLTDMWPSEEERRAAEATLSAQVEDLNEAFSPEAAQALLEQLDEAHGAARLSDEAYLRLYAQIQTLMASADGQTAGTVAEAAIGINWMLLRDSGWFEEYSDYDAALCNKYSVSLMSAAPGDNSSSAQQVDEPGGAASHEDVTVSKTIQGTALENVFDITLTVETPQKIEEVISEPDMAVVIVMDISNTMNSSFGGMTRYTAAMAAAENFLDQFAENNTLGVSKIGYVAFNTDAHEIFDLKPCTNPTQAGALKNTMRTQTGNIISKYEKAENDDAISHSRFTNVEAGLKMARDMLARASNKNKFIIFLSDGFPTTYISSGYNGYDPYTGSGTVGEDGVFHDDVLDVYCNYGTSYSDKAAIRAREMATAIKKSGINIFSIGVDVGGQTIGEYVTQSEGHKTFSVVDRTGETYEIGDANSQEAYKNWLKNSIGSGYYYDSNDVNGLKAAYDQIFKEIKTTVETASKADWVAEDPIPSVTPDDVELIGLYDKAGALQSRENALKGEHKENAENTARCEADAESKNDTIHWDLKESGYTVTSNSGITRYRYSLRYRVRLKNEDGSFVEKQRYNTNNTTTLQYRVVKSVNGTISVSDSNTIEFPIPAVHGYLGELTFKKVDSVGNPLSGAEFTLQHAESCTICRGDGSRVEVGDKVAISGADGWVTFKDIPSGHTYTLTETKVPPGHRENGNTYTVTVAYDVVTVEVKDSSGNVIERGWNGTIVNHTYYELPETGGGGAGWYYAAGALLCAAAGLLLVRQSRRKGDAPPS